MGDQDIMEKELLLIKGAADLYLHGSLEATTAEVHSAFKEALNEVLNIQKLKRLLNLIIQSFMTLL